MKKLLITGGCGFIGHHIVEHFMKVTDWEIVVLDRLSYASSGFNRLRDINVFDDRRIRTFTADLTMPLSVGVRDEIGDVDFLFHMAAETHVDNSIKGPEPFVMSNVVGTMHILNYAIGIKDLEAFCYFSTDEVFGPAPSGVLYKEWDRYNSTNPYSATKAGGEELCLAYANSYRLPLFVVHTMNAFGERQHPEKFIPMCIRKIIDGEVITIHADRDRQYSGSRFYIHCRNIANALHFLSDRFTIREKYNIVGEREVSNLELALTIARILGKELKYEMVDFHSSRPGHDLRYALDGGKMRGMGWEVPKTFEQSLGKTIRWYLENPIWLRLKH